MTLNFSNIWDKIIRDGGILSDAQRKAIVDETVHDSEGYYHADDFENYSDIDLVEAWNHAIIMYVGSNCSP